jgi:hypothetical protein
MVEMGFRIDNPSEESMKVRAGGFVRTPFEKLTSGSAKGGTQI